MTEEISDYQQAFDNIVTLFSPLAIRFVMPKNIATASIQVRQINTVIELLIITNQILGKILSATKTPYFASISQDLEKINAKIDNLTILQEPKENKI